MPHDHDHRHGHGHGHHAHGRDRHGNPEDLAAYMAKMEDPARVEWQRPDDVLAALGLKAEDVVAEVGAGPGFFTLRLAKVVRHVYAVEAEPKILSVLGERITAAGVRNVTPVMGLRGDPLLPCGACDLALVVDTFHHFPDGGVPYLRALAGALKPGGRLANIDFHRRELPVGPPVEHKVAREDFLRAAAEAGLELVSEPTFLPYQYFLILRPKA